MFRFRQFDIDDDRCAMKVGTDGVLLGAWARVGSSSRVLDVGAGCGLVSLMLAQRFPEVRLTALEIDTDAAEQARANVERSPFAAQVTVECADFLTYTAVQFDHIVSNPPFFEEDLLPPNAQRANARHTSAGLSFAALVDHSAVLLRDGGSLQVIIPKAAQARFHTLCTAAGFSLCRSTDVQTVERKAPKRVLLHFVKDAEAPETVLRDELVLMRAGQRSAEYAHLCRDFYL